MEKQDMHLKVNRFFWSFLGIAVLVLLNVQWVSAEIIPSAKRVTWQGNVGVKGGIPPRLTQCGNTVSPSGGDDTTAIQDAINACTTGLTVKLGPGDFNVSESIKMKNNVTVRGSGTTGPTRTTINTSKWRATFLFGFTTDFYLRNDVDLSADGVKGVTSVTLNSIPDWLKKGSVVGIDQLDDPSLVCHGRTGGCAQEEGESYRSIITGEDRNFGHTLKITDDPVGTTVTFEPPLAATFLKSQTAQLHQILPLDSQVTMAGLENLRVRATEVNSTEMSSLFEFSGSDNCWIKNILVDMGTGGPMVRTFYPYRLEIRDSNFHTFPDGLDGYDSGRGYGIALYYNATGSLIENNIVYDYHSGITINYGGAYNVVAYNYLPGPHEGNPPRQCVGLSTHGTHTYMNLFEGNDVNDKVLLDKTHGSGSHSTLLRNHVTGYKGATGGDYVAISIEGKNSYMNVLGNVLGLQGSANKYAGLCPSSDCGGNPVFKIGYGSNIQCSTTNYGGCDANVTTIDAVHTLIHGNYSYCAEAAGSGCNETKWDAGILDHSIPTTLYLSQKPAFFHSLAWPAIGSDLGTKVGVIPARYRYEHNGAEPPDGPEAMANGNPKLGMPPLAVTFSSAGSTDPEGDPLTYRWDFKDGSPISTAANPSHTFTTLGSYDVELTVSDGTTTSSPSKVNIFVGNKEPVALASANVTSGLAPLTVNFSSAGSADPEGVTLTYSWIFGDGTPLSTAANPSHTYTNLGSYDVTLTVSDGSKTASATLRIIVSNGLVAAFSFNEGTGTRLNDTSPFTNHGTIANGTWTSGRFGGALSFNGTSTMVNIPNSASLGLTTALTLEAWVYPTITGGWRDLIYKSNDIYFLMGSTTTNSAPAFGGTFASGNVFNTGALPLNTWSHLASTYDGAMMRLYLNGTQVASRAQTGSIMTSTDPLSLGGDAVAGQFWAGKIDEVRIYNRALSAGQIMTDKDAPIGATPTAPAAPSNLRLQ